MIRVLQVFGCMDRGGAESMIMELYRHIDRTKIQFDFVVHTTRKCAYDVEIVSLGGRIFSVPAFTIKTAYKYKKAWKQLLFQHMEWKIVHGHVRSTASIYLSIANKYNKYTIAHSHSISSGKGISSIVKDYLQKSINADYYFACSQKAGEWLFGKEITNSSNYSILPNAIDTLKFDFNPLVRERIRKETNCEKALLIGHVGSFYDVKNHDFLLRVFECIKKKNSSAKLMLVGEGYLKNEIIRQVNHLGLTDSVIFTGSRSDVNELLQAMDIFVFPSKFEGLPVILVEAQSTGVPIVMSDKVPNEVIMTDGLITVQLLDNSPEQWADHILSRTKINRYGHTKDIINHGFDISSTSKWLEDFYIEKNNIK